MKFSAFLTVVFLLCIFCMGKEVVDLRGYGRLELNLIRQKDQCTVSEFTAGDPDKARLSASKYLTDLQNYGAVSKNADGTVSVRHGGVWKVGLRGKRFYVIHGPDQKRLNEFIQGNGYSDLKAVPEKAYPAYLDNFDNSALCFWWKGTQKNAQDLEFLKKSEAQANILHGAGNLYAPGVADRSILAVSKKQLKESGKNYRTMLFGSSGNAWYNLLQWRDAVENNEPGFLSVNLFRAAGYYREKTASLDGEMLYAESVRLEMEAMKDDPNLLAWMEPHGEFNSYEYRRVADADNRFREFLKKKYTLKTLSQAWYGKPDVIKSWDAVRYFSLAYFHGMKNDYLALDDVQWKWKQSGLTDGTAKGFEKPSFNDSVWLKSLRANERFAAIYDHKTKPKDVWMRFSHDIPSDFLARNQKLYLHIMQASAGKGKDMVIWINGTEVKTNAFRRTNLHRQFEVKKLLKEGKNDFAVWHQNGPIRYMVFLSKEEDVDYPYADSGMNCQYLDWRSFTLDCKNETMRRFLCLQRTIDPVRPIKVMVPSTGFPIFEMFEQYGAYPQLTGEGSFYRPMHYKGYAALRGRTGSSEMAGPGRDPAGIQKIFGYMMYENQDMHDYGFDMKEEVTGKPEIKDWWLKHLPLLKTVGKYDLNDTRIGLLRDMDQDCLYNTGEIWKWDLSRGTLPALGMIPVLATAGDVIAGYADGKVNLLWDCATNVMKPELIRALHRYIKNGGVFIANFNTGVHDPLKTGSYPFFNSFGLKVKSTKTGNIVFDPAETLIPSLRGKTIQGFGGSVDHTGANSTGAISIADDPKLIPVARWENGGIAAAVMNYGKGKLIILGSPFWSRMKDDSGTWVNSEDRINLLAELLKSQGIERNTKVASGSNVWFDKRISKNGLYDVYFAGYIACKSKDVSSAKPGPVTSTELQIKRNRVPVIEVTADGCPDISVREKGSWLSLGEYGFEPFQIRQFAAVRDNVGIEAPRTWLREQEHGWFRLKSPEKYDLEKIRKFAEEYRKARGDEGMDLTDGWNAVLNFKKGQNKVQWEKEIPFGLWYCAGFPEGTECVRCEKTVTIPDSWKSERVFFRMKAPKYTKLGKLKVYLNGKPFPASGKIPDKFVKQGTFKITIESFDPKGKQGPQGVVFLHKLPTPKEIIPLDGKWTTILGIMEDGPEVELPCRADIMGIGKTVMIPDSLKGKNIRLNFDGGDTFYVLIVNGKRVNTLDRDNPTGIRLDGMLEFGKENRLELYSRAVMSKDHAAKINVKKIYLEVW